ncbi:MAG: hypothetical protein ACI849_001105, partial [Patiriisocius sp.]
MLFFLSLTGIAQENFICGVFGPSIPGGEPNEPTYSGSINPADIQTYPLIVFNIQFWQVNEEDGTNPNPVTEFQALTSVANLNQAYNQYKIFFKYTGLGEVNSPANVQYLGDEVFGDCTPQVDGNGNPIIDPHGYGKLEFCELGGFRSFIEDSNGMFYDDTAINVYIPYQIVNFGGVAEANSTNVIMNSGGLIQSGFIHEVGHMFGLKHTHLNYTLPAPDPTVDPNSVTSCENVTRDPSNPFFNALTRGDNVLDTAAVPDFIQEYCHFNPLDANCANQANYNAYYNVLDCNYIGENRNCYDEEYVINESDTRNIMAYVPGTCRDQFTTGQAIRMRERIAFNYLNRYSDAQIDVSALYYPYKGEYYLAGPQQNPADKPLFQPGFDYLFVDCNGPYPQPAPYGEIFTNDPFTNVATYYYDDNIPFNFITHPNHSAIRILEVETAMNGVFNVQKCYDNYNLSPIGGRVTRFNDNVLNTNITISPQDSLGINNPQLINTLDPGLYKIEKDFVGGAVEQIII